MAIQVHEVREALATYCAALVVDASYQRDTADAWRQVEFPLVPEVEPAQMAHLGFWIDDRDQVQSGTPAGLNSSFDDGAYLDTPLTFRALFELQPHAAAADWDRAGRAGIHMLRHLLRLEHSEINLVPDSAPMSRGFINQPGWVAVELRVRAQYLLSLAPGA